MTRRQSGIVAQSADRRIVGPAEIVAGAGDGLVAVVAADAAVVAAGAMAAVGTVADTAGTGVAGGTSNGFAQIPTDQPKGRDSGCGSFLLLKNQQS